MPNPRDIILQCPNADDFYFSRPMVMRIGQQVKLWAISLAAD
jgi:hypothetical protein